MSLMTPEVIHQLLVPFALRTFFIGGLFSLLVGFGLIVASAPTLRIFATMNRWVSYRTKLKPLSIPRDSWSMVEKHRRWFALVFIVAAIYALYHLTMTINAAAVAQYIAIKLHVPRLFAAWITASLWWFMIIGNALAVLIGVMLGFFPATMASLETDSKRWYSFRTASKGADAMHLSLDQWVAAYPRTAGAIIVIASLVEVIVVGVRVF